MKSIMSGLMTLHVACQKKFGLCPIMNFMSSLNLGVTHILNCQECVDKKTTDKHTSSTIIINNDVIP